MWLIRGIILVAGIVAIIWLGTVNAGIKVDFRLFTKDFNDLELNLILVVTLLSGVLFWAVFSWIKEAQLRLSLRKANKKIKSLEEEISALRNLPLEEDTGIEKTTE